MLLPVIAFGMDAPYRLNPEAIGRLSVGSLMWLAGFADSRRNVKVRCIFGCQRTSPLFAEPKAAEN